MKTIAIINQKGGVGKTTTAVSLGISLAQLGKKVLLVDLDGQANLTISLGFEPDEIENNLTKLIESRILKHDFVIDKKNYILNAEGVDIIPADITLSGMEAKMLYAINRECILKNILKDFKDDYDYILIDCLPSLGVLAVNALVSADSIIIPVQAQYLSLRGMEQLFETVNEIKGQLNPNLEIEGILLTMYNGSTTLSKEVSETIKEMYGNQIKVFENVIRISTKVAEAPSQGISIFKYNPTGKAAISYKLLANEVIAHE